MGQFGRIASIKDLPPKAELVRMVKRQAALIESGASAVRTPKAAKPSLDPPSEFVAALRKNAAARKTFEAFAPSHRREYVEWIVEARRAETREKRIAQAVEWLAEGKERHWKYR